MVSVPFRMICIAGLMVVSAALILTVYDSDDSDAAVLNGECGKEGNNLLWSYDEESRALTITGSGEMYNYLPSYARPWTDCISVSLPDGMTSIGRHAFYDCSSLSSVTIPDSVTSIGGHAFHGCSFLSSVTIPDSVTSIETHAFYGCSSLSSVTIPDSMTSIGSGAFRNCSSLSSVTIPDSVTSIEDYAFCNCSSLSSVTIPDSVTSIETHAFYGCSSLSSVTVPCGNPLGIEAGSTGNGYVAYYATEVTEVHHLTAIYTWEGITACSVRVFCEDCDYLAGIEHPEIESKVKIPPTETEMGTTEYYVSGTVEGYDYYSGKDVQDIPVVVPGNGSDNLIVYIAVAGAVAAIVLIGAALVLLRRR